MQGQKGFAAAFTTDDGIHFRDPGIRIFPYKLLIILVSTSLKDAAVIDLCTVYGADLVFHLFRKIKVPHRQSAGINVVIQRLLRESDLRVILKDHERGLALPDQRGDQFIKMGQIFF